MGKALAVRPNQTIPQAGAVPFRVSDDGQVQVLLINNSAGNWIVPKGGIDEGHTPRQMAHIETFEEAGVRGDLLAGDLGYYEYEKDDERCRVTLFAMRVREVLPSWPENKRRKRVWMSVQDASKKVAFEGLAAAINKLAKAV